MKNHVPFGWQKMVEDYPWFNCEGCYPITAYSEFMPSTRVGRKPFGEIDRSVFSDNDPHGWKITEVEEEYEMRPGIAHAGNQIMNNLIKLGKGLPEHFIHGHGGQNLKDNPYWPKELAAKAGSLTHEKYVTLLSLMLSRTKDDKGRIKWTLFGNTINDPGEAFWKCFYTDPGVEKPAKESISFFKKILRNAYGEKYTNNTSIAESGFRILSSADSPALSWTEELLINDDSSFDRVKYLLTFRPFSSLPPAVRENYLSGRLNLLPFPGSLVFWGMPGYNKLKKEFPLAGQIPLLNILERNRGIGGFKVAQSGWLHEPHPDNNHFEINEALLHDSFHRTNRWQRLHRYQDELNEVANKIKLVKVLFSTEADAMGLYGKPMARNSHLWTDNFDLLLNGPAATRKKIIEVEKTILGGGLFGFRFYFPPMKVGRYSVFLNRPLVAYLSAHSGNVEFNSQDLPGYLTAYGEDDKKMSDPVELWPRLLRRDLYLRALNDFNAHNDHFAHQTPMNILSLLDSWEMLKKRPLPRTFAHRLLNIAKHKTLEQWLEELAVHSNSDKAVQIVSSKLEKIIKPEYSDNLPQAITYPETANRRFEEAWWNDIRFLAHGQFINKDNADIIRAETTLTKTQKQHRDLEKLGDYLMSRHKKAIAEAWLEGIALCGELSFKWHTDFDYSIYGGWKDNQNGVTYERNILVVIPGKNRKQAVVFGDHYDTAYMEDLYEKERGGTGVHHAANGADDNHSASATLLQAAPIFLKLSKEGKLEKDVWLIHLTGEEFPADCMGARNLCQAVIEKNLKLKTENGNWTDLSKTEIIGLYVMDMIGHNRDNDQDIFQISPGESPASLFLAWHAHIANMIWNAGTIKWNRRKDRRHLGRGKRINKLQDIPGIASHLILEGEVRTRYNPHSSLFNTDGQIFSDAGIPVVLFMENYDINRTGYHDSHDTLENIDLDYGSAFAAIAIETVARIAMIPEVGF